MLSLPPWKQRRGCLCIFIPPAAAAKSLQSCPTLCDPIDGSPPGSAVPGIFQARGLEWVAIAFSALLPDLPHSSVGKESACKAGDPGWIPGSGRSPGEGKDYLLRYAGLENSMACLYSYKDQTWLGNFLFTLCPSGMFYIQMFFLLLVFHISC